MAESGACDSFKSASETEKQNYIALEDIPSDAPVPKSNVAEPDILDDTTKKDGNISLGDEMDNTGVAASNKFMSTSKTGKGNDVDLQDKPTDAVVPKSNVAEPDIVDDTTKKVGNITLGDEMPKSNVAEPDILDDTTKKVGNISLGDEMSETYFDCLDAAPEEEKNLPPYKEIVSESGEAASDCTNAKPEEKKYLPLYVDIPPESGAAYSEWFEAKHGEKENLPPRVAIAGEPQGLLTFYRDERPSGISFQQRRGAQFGRSNCEVSSPYTAANLHCPQMQGIPEVDETVIDIEDAGSLGCTFCRECYGDVKRCDQLKKDSPVKYWDESKSNVAEPDIHDDTTEKDGNMSLVDEMDNTGVAASDKLMSSSKTGNDEDVVLQDKPADAPV